MFDSFNTAIHASFFRRGGSLNDALHRHLSKQKNQACTYGRSIALNKDLNS